MLAGGADISTVSKLLGHASISITADVDAHLGAGVGQRAVDGAANLIAHKVALTSHSQPGLSWCCRQRLEGLQGVMLVGLARFELATP
jgi:hypothetical protein